MEISRVKGERKVNVYVGVPPRLYIMKLCKDTWGATRLRYGLPWYSYS